MPFLAARLVELRQAKGLERRDLAEWAGVSVSQVTKHENGDQSSTETIEKFADALDCTLDYLYGRGAEYIDAVDAAVQMSFDVFTRTCSEERRERCKRILRHAAPPRTSRAWLRLSEQIELAIGPSGDGRDLRLVRDAG